MIVLKDIWGLDKERAQRVAIWAARSLVRTALAESGGKKVLASAKKKKTLAGKSRNGRGKQV
jgi:hypothetical protein